MRRLLIGTTAIVAASFMGSDAFAQATKPAPVQIRVGGYFQAFFAVGDEDDGLGEPGADRRDHGVVREAEVHFLGMTTLDNGLKVGIDVQLEAETCGDQIDESYLFFESPTWGRVNLGAENGAAYLMTYNAPSVLSGHGISDPTFSHGQNGANTVDEIFFHGGRTSGDSEKLTYFTPSFGGFQVGVSYTPDTCEENNSSGGCGGSFGGMEPDNNANQQSEVKEIAARYQGTFGDFTLGVAANFSTAENEAPTAGFGDREEWGMSASVGFGGFTVAGGYREDDLGVSGDGDRTDWGVGARYRMGQWGFSLSYGHAETEDPTAGGEDELDLYELGVDYVLGPGISLLGGIIHYDWSDNAGNPANENEATFFVVGTSINF